MMGPLRRVPSWHRLWLTARGRFIKVVKVEAVYGGQRRRSHRTYWLVNGQFYRAAGTGLLVDAGLWISRRNRP